MTIIFRQRRRYSDDDGADSCNTHWRSIVEVNVRKLNSRFRNCIPSRGPYSGQHVKEKNQKG